MNGRLSPPPRSEWAPVARGRGEQKPRCCAKCRRGVPGYGDLPCGYPDMKCPNKCHEPKSTGNQEGTQP